MKNEFTPRVGTFFFLVGGLLLMLFVGSVVGKEPRGAYLLFSLAAFFLTYLLRRGRARPEPTRFSSIRKAKERARKRREEKRVKDDKKDDKTNPPPRSNF